MVWEDPATGATPATAPTVEVATGLEEVSGVRGEVEEADIRTEGIDGVADDVGVDQDLKI